MPKYLQSVEYVLDIVAVMLDALMNLTLPTSLYI